MAPRARRLHQQPRPLDGAPKEELEATLNAQQEERAVAAKLRARMRRDEATQALREAIANNSLEQLRSTISKAVHEDVGDALITRGKETQRMLAQRRYPSEGEVSP